MPNPSSNPVADFLNAIPKTKRRPIQKRKAVVTRYDHRKLYDDARRVMWLREYPSSYAYGYYSKVIDTRKTNGTQNYIQDVLNNLGHQCERVNTGGIAAKDKNGQFKFRFSGSTKGSSDLHAILNGRAWKIEIKKDRDVLSGSQEKYRDKTIAAGGLHSVVYVGDLDFFWDEYYKYLKL